MVDAFTAQPFAGNPAAVAREFNLSETAFLTPVGQDRYGLRWFTPALEVELCGHATLASAHWLGEQGLCGDRVEFDTASGTLSARADAGRVTLDLPAVPLGGVVVTAPADQAARAEGVDVLSRYFCPALGIAEDPVTGSAHCTLAGYWCERLDRSSFRAAQLSERGGLLDVALDGDAPSRVLVTGSATTVMDVTLR